ncbi:hypothetical protein NP493_843g01009 [Ridgeia piscesae]|uniref:Uncharacterized protein n=1 Tax=Ridgeia piscesae TaxID=27915 RepID=A0AAD9KLQ4_RIDPI|nr:hypothetical protein NP493_843g01009 [Ridgeia piscesae]
MYAQYTYLFVDGYSCQLSICIWFSATNTFRSTSCLKQRISNPTFRNTQQSTFINMLRALPSCSHFMTADKLVTASTNWFGTAVAVQNVERSRTLNVSSSCQKVSGSWRRLATSSSPERRSTYAHAR